MSRQFDTEVEKQICVYLHLIYFLNMYDYYYLFIYLLVLFEVSFARFQTIISAAVYESFEILAFVKSSCISANTHTTNLNCIYCIGDGCLNICFFFFFQFAFTRAANMYG